MDNPISTDTKDSIREAFKEAYSGIINDTGMTIPLLPDERIGMMQIPIAFDRRFLIADKPDIDILEEWLIGAMVRIYGAELSCDEHKELYCLKESIRQSKELKGECIFITEDQYYGIRTSLMTQRYSPEFNEILNQLYRKFNV